MMAHDRAEAALEAAEAGAVPAYLSGHAGDTASTYTPVLVGPVPYPPSEASKEERAAIRKEAFEEAAIIADGHDHRGDIGDAIRRHAIRARGET